MNKELDEFIECDGRIRPMSSRNLFILSYGMRMLQSDFGDHAINQSFNQSCNHSFKYLIIRVAGRSNHQLKKLAHEEGQEQTRKERERKIKRHRRIRNDNATGSKSTTVHVRR